VFETEAEWRIFEAAFDGLHLWDLPGRHVYSDAGGQKITPDIAIDTIRGALVGALGRGLVELFEADSDDHARLSLQDALALVADDGEWSAESSTRAVALTVTPAGERESHAVWDRLKRSSPFRAAGASDPRQASGDERPAV
jgi:hypothetical protein